MVMVPNILIINDVPHKMLVVHMNILLLPVYSNGFIKSNLKYSLIVQLFGL
jgi:hypothetical protein